MRYSKSMIEAVRQVGLYERFDFVVVDKDNKIVTRQPNKQDAKEFVGFANSKFFKNTTMGEKYKKPFKVAPISPKDRIKKDTTKMVKKKNKGGLLVTPKLAQRGF